MKIDLTDDIIYLNALKVETENLNKARKHYKIQSEWLRMMTFLPSEMKYPAAVMMDSI